MAFLTLSASSGSQIFLSPRTTNTDTAECNGELGGIAENWRLGVPGRMRTASARSSASIPFGSFRTIPTLQNVISKVLSQIERSAGLNFGNGIFSSISE